MYRNTQFRTKTESTFRMKEVDSSLLVRLHRSIKFKIAHARFTCLCFFTGAHFHLASVAAKISHFVTAAPIFSCCSSNKKMSPLFLSLALDLFLVELRWPAAQLLSLFFCLSPALFSKFVDITVNLS